MRGLKGKQIILAVTNDLTYDRRMFRICSTLAESGGAVTLVGRRLKNSADFHPGNFKGARLKCWFTKGPLFYLEYNIRLFFFLMSSGFDVACACDLDTALAVHFASRLKGKKTVYDAHEYFTEVPELTGRSLVKSVWEWIGKLTIPRFDLRYTVGEELAKIMGEKYKVPFQTIRNIPSVVQKNNAIPQSSVRSKILLYQGAINVGRGLEETIRAMVELHDWELWLAGQGDITESLMQLSKDLRVQERVRFIGWVHPDDLPALMKQAQLGINLREKGSLNDYYSLPNKFFDFIHAGLPSIHMDYPEYKAVISKYRCALMLGDVSAQSIVNAIRMLENNAEDLQQMKSACLEAAREFTWEKEGQKLVMYYDEIMIPDGQL